nr:hypothetical protein Iba_chr10cCG13110 [Ipomoea batatas]GMD48915.1 hypothetical protein Iba_chr10fCG10860 [Ipomoea batatas]
MVHQLWPQFSRTETCFKNGRLNSKQWLIASSPCAISCLMLYVPEVHLVTGVTFSNR